MSAKPALNAQSARGNAFRANRQVSKNSELFKKPEPGAQFHWERISSNDQPSHSTSGSEAELTTNSWYSSFRDRKRSLDQWSLRRAFRHSLVIGAASLGLRRLSVSGSDSRRGKTSITVCLHTVSRDKDRPSGYLVQASQDLNFEDVGSRHVYGP